MEGYIGEQTTFPGAERGQMGDIHYVVAGFVACPVFITIPGGVHGRAIVACVERSFPRAQDEAFPKDLLKDFGPLSRTG
jgi:hypothetical protein